MPREDWDDTDEIFGENIHSRFDRAYQMEMYIANLEGYEGDGDLFTKFGLEIREGSSFIVTKKTFEKYVPSVLAARPREGDLLFVPVMNKIMEIKFVEEELLFFSRGQRLPYMYEMRCEDFRYANEQINTGVEIIDQSDTLASYTIQLALSGTGNYNNNETVYQGANLEFATATAKVSSWDPKTRKINLVDIKGEFSTSTNLKGVDSNATMIVTTTDTITDFVYYDLYNNRDIELEANNFVDLSEINPFGTP